MKALLYCNTTTKALTDGSGTWTPPTLVFGEQMTIGLRFQAQIDGATSEISADVRYLKAAIGNVDLRPKFETFCLKVGDAPRSSSNTTVPLPWNAGAQAFVTALNALATATEFGQVTARNVDGSMIFKFGTGAVDVTLEAVNNQMEPSSLGIVSAWQVNGLWYQELRLIEAPVAFCDYSARILPPAPTVTEVQVGGSDGEFYWNEIQQMVMPPDFRGTFQFRWKNVRTGLLSRDDGPDELTTALAVYGKTITATNPRPAVARFEFSGAFQGLPEPLLEVIVVDAPEGDLTFTMALTKPPLAAMLRTQDNIELPLQIEVGIGDSSVEGGVRVDQYRTTVTIQRGIIFDMMATAAAIEWLRPLAPDYVPFTLDQIRIGPLYYAHPLGDGSARSFVIDHNLNTDAVGAVLLRENFAGGRLLKDGTDYEVTFAGPNSLTVTLKDGVTTPATDGLAVVISAATPTSIFAPHTHTIEQIVGLSTALENLAARVTTLESYIPANPPSVAALGTSVLSIVIPKRGEILFTTQIDPTKLPARAPFLLPMVSGTRCGTLDTVLPDPIQTAGVLWTLDSSRIIPISGGIHSMFADTNTVNAVASDGRTLFPVRQSGSSNSWFPIPFERSLWEFGINGKQLTVNRTLDVEFAVAVQLINATCEAQWVLVIDQGAIVDATDPSPEDPNLQYIVWSDTPILSQRILLTGNKVLHPFGVRIQRLASSLVANRMLYGNWEAANATGAAPASADFGLRARRINFDTKNNVSSARGWLSYALGGVPASGVTELTNDITATIS